MNEEQNKAVVQAATYRANAKEAHDHFMATWTFRVAYAAAPAVAVAMVMWWPGVRLGVAVAVMMLMCYVAARLYRELVTERIKNSAMAHALMDLGHQLVVAKLKLGEIEAPDDALSS
jgi:hypothetical protein